jgi:hypothetical protein
VLKAGGGFRVADPDVEAARAQRFREVKDRLERWLQGLDEKDPYRVLGVSPDSTLDEVRARYREAALLHHPDRGGSVQKMAEINLAFERITGHQERHAKAALPARGTPTSNWAPPLGRREAVAVSRRRYGVPVSVLDRA